MSPNHHRNEIYDFEGKISDSLDMLNQLCKFQSISIGN